MVSQRRKSRTSRRQRLATDTDRVGDLHRLVAQSGSGPGTSRFDAPSSDVCEMAKDCRFLTQCPTYADKLIPTSSKEKTGLGCIGQTDSYRQEHCRAFACKLLVGILKSLATALGRR